jgi:hypothetical protein
MFSESRSLLMYHIVLSNLQYLRFEIVGHHSIEKEMSPVASVVFFFVGLKNTVKIIGFESNISSLLKTAYALTTKLYRFASPHPVFVVCKHIR